MNPRLVLWLIVALAAWSVGWRAWGSLDGRLVPLDPQLTALVVGDSVTLPVALQGDCAHLVAFHGSCYGCERFVRGRERAWWLTRDEHPRDILFPRVVVSPQLFRTLKIGGIPVEFLVSGKGRVTYTGGPNVPQPPSCPTNL